MEYSRGFKMEDMTSRPHLKLDEKEDTKGRQVPRRQLIEMRATTKTQGTIGNLPCRSCRYAALSVKFSSAHAGPGTLKEREDGRTVLLRQVEERQIF